MTLLVLQRQLDENWRQLVLVAIFVVLPLVARVFRWLVGKMQSAGRSAPATQEERRLRREARRTEESAGEETWRRLLRGEEAPVEQRTAPPASLPRRASEPEEAAPDPLAVLGRAKRVSEDAQAETAIAEAALEEVSLENLAVAPPLDALAGKRAEAPVGVKRRAFLALGERTELARAIVLAEVLGPPLSERR